VYAVMPALLAWWSTAPFLHALNMAHAAWLWGDVLVLLKQWLEVRKMRRGARMSVPGLRSIDQFVAAALAEAW
jgi:hypothetical protein